MKIHNILTNLLFLFVMVAFVSGQEKNLRSVTITNDPVDEKLLNQQIKNEISSAKQPGKSKLLWSFGTNLSSYVHRKSEWKPGYNVGLTFYFRVCKNLSITLPFSYTRIYTAFKNLEGKFYSNDGHIYKAFFNPDISIGFLEIPILFSYKFFTAKKYDLSFIGGSALAIAAKDYSTPIQPEDVTITDEIIGTYDELPIYPSENFTYYNSGININTGIRFHVSRFYVDMLYILYPYKIKGINKLNSISLRLGIDVH